jgi:hypothetical protein
MIKIKIMKIVEEFKNYVVYENGVIVNTKTNKTLSVSICDKGYPKVNFYVNGKVVTRRVHTIVAKAYIDNPLNLKEVNHINGNKKDFSISNLEWVTHSQNLIHAYKTGLQIPSPKRRTKVVDIVYGIFYDSVKEAANALNMKPQTLANRLSGHRKNNTNIRYA